MARLEFNRSNALTVANVISGTGSLTRPAPAPRRLTGNNSYTALRRSRPAPCSVGDGGTTGSLGAGDITNDATLQFNRSNALTVANAISGTGKRRPGRRGHDLPDPQPTPTPAPPRSRPVPSASAMAARPARSAPATSSTTPRCGSTAPTASPIANAISRHRQPRPSPAPGTTLLTGTNSYSGGTTVAGGTLQGTTASLQGNILNNAT